MWHVNVESSLVWMSIVISREGRQRLQIDFVQCLLNKASTMLVIVHLDTQKTTQTDCSLRCLVILTYWMTQCVVLTTEQVYCVEGVLMDMVLQYTPLTWNVLTVPSYPWGLLCTCFLSLFLSHYFTFVWSFSVSTSWVASCYRVCIVLSGIYVFKNL